MGKVKEKIATGFQWKLKWVRVMLIASTVAILVLIIIQNVMPEKRQIPTYTPEVYYELPAEIYLDTIQQETLPRPQPRRFITPVDEPKEPFDWKGTITWAIGAMNGLILIVLNIKNLILKKK